MNKPALTLHNDFKIEARVSIKKNSGFADGLTGTIVGYASSKHIACNYIVLLDSPLAQNGESVRAISIIGTLLEEI